MTSVHRHGMHSVPDVEVPAQRATYRGSLSDNACKARYGVTYLRALCNQAGLPLMETSQDEDAQAIDCMITFHIGVVMVQVKCTSQFKLRGKTASWPMELHWQKSWQAMRHPVYFVMVIVDDGDPQTWLKHHEDGTFHYAAAYWTRVDIDTPTDTIRIDKRQRLTTETFHRWSLDLSACFAPLTVPDAS
jgi:Domain of unknown function (DUF4365)